MPISPRQNLLCNYHYDALDRSISWAPTGQAGIQRFHCKERLATEIQNSGRHSIFQHDDHVLAQQQHMNDQVNITLMATDLQRTVLNALDAGRAQPIAYTPYGHRRSYNGLLSLLGFNGERPDPVTGHYHLGNGYRQFNPVLMRFNSPDSLSPFGKGGLNAYAYCSGNPVLNVDPHGRYIEKVVRTMNARIFLRTGRTEITAHTRAAIANTPPIWVRGDGHTSPDDVIRQLINDNIIGSHDNEILHTFKYAKPAEAESLLPRARRHQTEFEKRLAIVTDAEYATENDNIDIHTVKRMETYRKELNSAADKLIFKAEAHKNHMRRLTPHNQNSSRTLRNDSKNLRQPEQ
ncbi:RHS repeat-associated core domain-containing protein [Pseudomonas sp. NPDC087336]|uniref:RHS repeat-associated core domain-containing protein n=1 Tax=Pseudomonas sp. NPDC087336 TaxID=3364436 RepID=UPI0037FF2ADF